MATSGHNNKMAGKGSCSGVKVCECEILLLFWLGTTVSGQKLVIEKSKFCLL